MRARAQQHYQSGAESYRAGSYEIALREFEAGYELSQRPEFLLNLAAAHGKLGHVEDARRLNEKYLELAPDSPRREQVRRRVAELQLDDREDPLSAPDATPAVLTTKAPMPRAKKMLIAGGSLLAVGVFAIAAGGGLLGGAAQLNGELGRVGSTYDSAKAERMDAFQGSGAGLMVVGLAAAISGATVTTIAVRGRF